MDKKQLILLIIENLNSGKISKEDLRILAGVGATPPQVAPVSVPQEPQEDNSKKLINIFYAIGAIIAVVGVGILVGQNWNDIGFAGRVLVTLGISFGAYVTGLLARGQEHKMLSQVMFVVSAVLAPLGSYVVFAEAGISFTRDVQLMVALVLSVIFGVALVISKRSMLVLITIGFASWAYFALIFKAFITSDYGGGNILDWATMLLGVSYILIGYGYGAIVSSDGNSSGKENNAIKNFLYSFGTLAVLIGGASIGGAFDLFNIILIFAAFYGSVYLKNGAMLKLGALFLMAHIIKLTSKYFADSIGWPVALIGVGFLVIGVGYGTHYLNQKFIKGI